MAEGSGKLSGKDRRRFYSMAFGSLREVQAIFDLLELEHEFRQSDQLAAMIFRLIQNPGP